VAGSRQSGLAVRRTVLDVPAGRKLRLLHPKWLLLHAFTLAAGISMVLLGRWQWHVAHRHHGDIRYYAYAFQWWAFVGFAGLMWSRIVLDHLRRDVPTAPVQPAPPSRYLAYQPPPPAADADPERARFNSYLAQLDAADRAAQAGVDRKGEQ
jgi:hypothetical protein